MLLVITDLSCFAQDVGVISVLSPNSSYALGTAEVVEVQIHNYGTVSVSNIPVLYSVNGILSPVEYVPGPLAPSATYNYAFTATADLHIYNYYNICAGTLYPGDHPIPSLKTV